MKRVVVGVALLMVLSAACGGQRPADTSTAGAIDTFEPDETFEPDDTFEPEDTSQDPFDDEQTFPPEPTAKGVKLDFGSGLRTSVVAILDSGIYGTQFGDGTFTSTGASRVCGVVSPYPRSLSFEFPSDLPTGDIRDATFFAEDLVPGTTTSSFQLSVSVGNATVGSPDVTGLNTADGATGTAGLTVDPEGARKLVADIAGEGGVSVHLEVTCGPGAG